MSPAPLTAFCDATVMTGDSVVENHALLVRGTTITDLVPNRQIPDDARRVDCSGQIVAPGLIDAQVNGGGNVLLNNTPTVDSCYAIARAHRAHGTTGMLLTCISDTPAATRAAIQAVHDARKEDPSILGIHLEGPHLSTERRGVHNLSVLRHIDPADLQLYRDDGNGVTLITVAPENVTPAQIAELAKHAVISLGHTAASPEQIRAALAAGATGFTHLYNAMSGMSARAPGVIGTALDDANSWCSMIADDHHVVPEMIRLALRSKPLGKVFLVSDAMAPAGAENPEPFALYGETITVANGCCLSPEGKLAGSAITLLDAVRYCVKKVGVEVDEALRMASTYPAAFLKVGHRLGRLLPGYAADIITLSPELELQDVWPAGNA